MAYTVIHGTHAEKDRGLPCVLAMCNFFLQCTLKVSKNVCPQKMILYYVVNKEKMNKKIKSIFNSISGFSNRENMTPIRTLYFSEKYQEFSSLEREYDKKFIENNYIKVSTHADSSTYGRRLLKKLKI